MLSARVLAVCVALVACRNDADPGFEVVRVPLSAYAMPDASVRDDAGAPAPPPGEPQPIVVCVPPKQSDDDESDDCAGTYQGRTYDPHVTERHRNKGEEGVCCYRRGRSPRSNDEPGD